MTALIAVLGVVLVLVVIVLDGLVGWPRLSILQRLALASLASALLLAGSGRFMGHAPGLADAQVFVSLAFYLGSTRGPAIIERLDPRDGVADGRFDLRAWWRRVAGRARSSGGHGRPAGLSSPSSAAKQSGRTPS